VRSTSVPYARARGGGMPDANFTPAVTRLSPIQRSESRSFPQYRGNGLCKRATIAINDPRA